MSSGPHSPCCTQPSVCRGDHHMESCYPQASGHDSCRYSPNTDWTSRFLAYYNPMWFSATVNMYCFLDFPLQWGFATVKMYCLLAYSPNEFFNCQDVMFGVFCNSQDVLFGVSCNCQDVQLAGLYHPRFCNCQHVHLVFFCICQDLLLAGLYHPSLLKL